MSQQLRALRRGVDVVVATPGRALDLIRRGTLALGAVEFLVLDEADEMLDMGFAEELEAIVAAVPAERQTALFSATIAPRIKKIAKSYTRDAVYVTIASEEHAAGQELSRARGCVRRRTRAQGRCARARDRHGITELGDRLLPHAYRSRRTHRNASSARGYQAEAIHGGLSQEQRDRVLRRFRDGTSELLVATDVAARGLDIEHLSHVFNFDVPSSPDAYVHRIGRTGRAGREGVAITLAEPREHRLLHNIELHTKRKIRVETVPTVHDLRERRFELMKASLEEALESGGLERYRSVVEVLASEYDVLDLAAAAVKLADQGRTDAQAEEVNIPPAPLAPVQEAVGARPSSQPSAEVAKLFVGVGRAAGIRPADLVGAIANEAGISSRSIGAIDIADRFSLVEVPASQIDDIIRKLRGSTIRGKKVNVRRDREGAPERKRR